MASVPVGTKLGKYEIVKPLAGGGMAELLLARTAPTERPLVLKWIRPEQAIDGTFVEAFVSEGRRAAQLHHPNIVAVHEVGREDGTHYLAMEYVHGDDLRKLLARLHERRAKLPVQHILAITTALAQALHHAHEQLDADGDPVLHLGIKPGNVIITADGAVKLADFGIGRAALTEGRTDLLSAIVGYLSPEQCTGQPVDRRSDVFGLGILMYELSVGRRLFKGDNEFITMATIVAGDVPMPTKLRGDLPKELEAVIMKALARAPEDRFQTAHEVFAALEKFATKAGVRGSLTTLAGYTKRLFGVRPEPWLVDEEATTEAGSMTGEFDTSPKGLATPPPEALSCGLPSFVRVGDDSPIARIRKQVSRDLPTEQLNLAALKTATPPPERSTPVKIPAAASGANGRAAARPAMPAPVAPSRNKPKTVQIPTVDKGVNKEESTKVLVSGDLREETQERTNVVGKDEVTKESIQMPAMSAAESGVNTPTIPQPRIIESRDDTKPIIEPASERAKTTPRDEDTVPAAMPLMPPSTNGVKPKPQVISLAGLKEADEKRERAKKAILPPPKPFTTGGAAGGAVGEIRPRGATPADQERTETDVDDLIVESTAVANPPPMPTSVPRDLTDHVRPLPITRHQSTTEGITLNRKRRRLAIIAAIGVAAIALAVAGVVAFSGGDVEPSASEQVAVDEPVVVPKPDDPDDPAKRETQPSELRTSGGPRTPRNSHVTAGDETETTPTEPTPTEKAPEPVAAEPPKPEPPPPPEPEPEPVVVKEEPKPKFVEPKDPSPPDDEKPAKKPKKATEKAPKVAAKKPAPKPKKPVAKPVSKPTVAKPTTKPTTKPKWDRNALFPK